MDSVQIKRNPERIKRKRKNEGIARRIETLVKKSHELGGVDGVDLALIISKYGRYTNLLIDLGIIKHGHHLW
jgi:hypothetical protein